jgi:uncharacterized membrane protein YfcA
VDAVVGGGGLIQLPAIVIGLPGASPVQMLATNKLASFCGTTVSSATYYRRVGPDPRTFLPLMGFAFLGAACGAGVAFLIPRSAFNPIILAVLVVVGAYVLLKPGVGELTELRFGGHRHTAAAMVTGLVVGFYDGALGPGTGSFFVFTLVCSATTSWRRPRRRGSRTGPRTSRRWWSSSLRVSCTGRSAW